MSRRRTAGMMQRPRLLLWWSTSLVMLLQLQLLLLTSAASLPGKGLRSVPLGWACAWGLRARRRHMRMSLGAEAAAGGGGGGGGNGGDGREGIAAHQEAMRGFAVEDALIHHDDDIVVVHKPPNALCVPGRYIQDSLVVRVAEHFSIKDYARMVVHRLDQATSGLVVFAKHEGALKHLHAQLREKAADAVAQGGGPAAVEKGYVALVSTARGPVEPTQGRIALPIAKDVNNPPKQMVDMDAGKPSLTLYRVRRAGADSCLVGLQPVTGRTHQLRVHLSATGHPILGDSFYAPLSIQARSPDRLCLHAETIAFVHPGTAERVRFHYPYPAAWDEGLEAVEGQGQGEGEGGGP